ncbi:MAG: tyrosine-type recombinase/integrase, partial [Ruminococcus sp.]
RFIKQACTALKIGATVGTHTMRKSFGYHHYRKHKDVAILQTIFNHSAPSITLHYIGVQQDEINLSYFALKLCA